MTDEEFVKSVKSVYPKAYAQEKQYFNHQRKQYYIDTGELNFSGVVLTDLFFDEGWAWHNAAKQIRKQVLNRLCS